MRRLLLVLSVALVMAAMMVAMVAPAFAGQHIRHGGGGGGGERGGPEGIPGGGRAVIACVFTGEQQGGPPFCPEQDSL